MQIVYDLSTRRIGFSAIYATKEHFKLQIRHVRIPEYTSLIALKNDRDSEIAMEHGL